MEHSALVKFETIIEDAIDSRGLRGVLDIISQICYEKADHLRSNWQDEVTAREWDDMGKQVDRFADFVRQRYESGRRISMAMRRY